MMIIISDLFEKLEQQSVVQLSVALELSVCEHSEKKIVNNCEYKSTK